MGEFARVVQPHLDAHGIEGPEELARRLRADGELREAHEVEQWVSGNPVHAGPGDVLAMERIFGLSDEEVSALQEAFMADVRTSWPS